jgi:ankyrin repeat protein
MGHIEAVKLLLAKRAEIGDRISRVSIPLAYAAATGHVEIAKMLVEAGSYIDVCFEKKIPQMKLKTLGENIHEAKVLSLTIRNHITTDMYNN